MERNEEVLKILKTFKGKIFSWKDIKKALDCVSKDITFDLHNSFTSKHVIVDGKDYVIEVLDDFVTNIY